MPHALLSPTRAFRTCDPLQLALRWVLIASTLAALVTEDDGSAHMLAGATLGLCLILRLLWGLVGPHSASLAALWPGRDEIRLQIADLMQSEKRYDLGPSPIGAAMSLVLLATLALLVLSGAAMAMSAQTTLEPLHEALTLVFAVTLAAYMAGLLWASLHYRVNLVWAVLSGVKPLPDDLYWDNGPDLDPTAAHPRAGNPGANP
ncbi:cytochrome b/b6 domain-containing protein [Marinovum sp.]|uniref:cytochrome b/b6 domain-containing protein n=1 Tax=Marinovum sp. TaxID=2024839 RepID=UPI003A8E5965